MASVTVWSSAAHAFWVAWEGHQRRASLGIGTQGGNIPLDKAKRSELETQSVSAPSTSLIGPGVDTDSRP